MPYANNKGVRIHYQVEGKGPPLVMYHGFGAYLQSWYAMGYVEGLKDEYQLVLIDARGCGSRRYSIDNDGSLAVPGRREG
jgi:pimeloyl-ACP methyl ester carboxylesterase